MKKKIVEVDEDVLKEIIVGDIPVFGKDSPVPKEKPVEHQEAKSPAATVQADAPAEKPAVEKPKWNKDESCGYRERFLGNIPASNRSHVYINREVAECIKKTAFRITRMGQLVAQEASRRLDTPFGIVDLSLAPTPAVGDSVARILEEMGLEVCGTHGTPAALALLNDAVKKGGVMASGHVGGLSGAVIPVSEDEGMIAAARSGVLTIDKLEAMTCVCSVGLDMIAVPGDTTAETISAIIADEAAVGMVNSKTTAVRIIPVEGKTVGDTVELGGLLGSAPLMPVHDASSADFIARGGRIPAPLQSLKN